MSYLINKSAAWSKFKKLDKKYNAKINLNWRKSSIKDINDKSKFIEDNKDTFKPKIKKINARSELVRSRSSLYNELKRINPNSEIKYISSSEGDLRRALLKEKSNLLESKLDSINIKNFLNNPEDEKKIDVRPKSLLKNLNTYIENKDFLLILGYNVNGKKEYRTINNIEIINTILSNITKGYKLREIDLEGSDAEIITALKQYDSLVELQWIVKGNFNRQSGAWFPYYNLTNIDLSTQQVFTKKDKSIDNENCLIYALIKSELISDDQITCIKNMIHTKHLSLLDLSKISKILDVKINLEFIKNDRVFRKVYGAKSNKSIDLGLFENHYFLNTTEFLKFDITKKAIDNNIDGKIEKIGKAKKGNTLKPLSMINILKNMLKNNLFEPITLANVTNKDLNEKLVEYNNLEEGTKDNCTLMSSKGYSLFSSYSKKIDLNKNFNVCFMDTETFLDNGEHTAFNIESTTYKYNNFDSMRLSKPNTNSFYGINCAKEFLESLTGNTLIYMHNAAFDFRFILNKMYDHEHYISSGNRLKTIQGKYIKSNGSYVNIVIKCTLAFLNTKLSNLPSMFGLKKIEKAPYPYDLINRENINSFIPFDKCCEHIKDNEVDDFKKALIKSNSINNGIVDIKNYTIHYCRLDVEIMSKAFLKFREQIFEVCNNDIFGKVSLPAVSYDYLYSNKCFDGCYNLSGIPRDFINQCWAGGRVMCANNTKQISKATKLDDGSYKNVIQDFDAVSLYPSSMNRLKGFVIGMPKVIKTFEPSKYDEYFIKVLITSVGKNRDFPLYSIKQENGIRLNTNDLVGKYIHVDKTTLEDLIKFQSIEYEFIQGYYFDEGFNDNIVKTIKNMFETRLNLKKQGNNLEQVYKLLMNASYGKLIQKAISSEKNFINSKDKNSYITKNYRTIVKWKEISNELNVFTKKKSIIDHYNAPHLASQVLSMSKRIMNEVMCLAEDNDIKIFYQDTDSMHLYGEDIDKLSNLYKQTYDRELIGKYMGQFHSDFSVSESGAKNIEAIESIFIGKKCYIDKLKYNIDGSDEDRFDYHIRIKGVPSQSIKDYDVDIMNTYMRLFNGDSLKFNLDKYCPIKLTDDFRAIKNTDMTRVLKF